MVCYILQQKRNEQKQILTIYLDKDEVIVGKKTFPLLSTFSRVSSKHAKFQRCSGELYIKDLGSKDGLFVNSRNVGAALHLLKIGDEIGFGGLETNQGAFVCTLLEETCAEAGTDVNTSTNPELFTISDRSVTNAVGIEEENLNYDNFYHFFDCNYESNIKLHKRKVHDVNNERKIPHFSIENCQKKNLFTPLSSFDSSYTSDELNSNLRGKSTIGYLNTLQANTPYELLSLNSSYDVSKGGISTDAGERKLKSVLGGILEKRTSFRDSSESKKKIKLSEVSNSYIQSSQTLTARLDTGVQNNELCISNASSLNSNLIPQLKNKEEALRRKSFSPLSCDSLLHSQKTSVPEKETWSKGNKKRILLSNMVRTIVHWNYVWLKEQSEQLILPEPVSKCVIQLPEKFESIDSYISSFTAMITLEIWEIVHQRSKPIFQSSFERNRFYFYILDSFDDGNVTVCNCEIFVDESSSLVPRDGSIILFRNPCELQQTREKPSSYALGYISESKMTQSDEFSSISELCKKSLERLDSFKLWTAKLCTKRRPVLLPKKMLIEANTVCDVYEKVAACDALLDLKTSIFLPDILNPHREIFTFPIVKKDNFFHEIISNIVSDITKSPEDPKITLLHGPPATGKTHALVCILQDLVYGRKLEKMILVMAPSSTALEEISNRLTEINESEGKKLKFARLDTFKNSCKNTFIDADIVLATLSEFLRYTSTSGLKDMIEGQFSLCIVDESTQCTEPEILSPFILNIKKLILLGGCEELPAPVHSKYAADCLFGRSLFVRFEHNFLNWIEEMPIHVLSTQFRMHPQICNFISEYFYHGTLISAPDIAKKYEIYPLHPLSVIDVSSNSPLSNLEQRALLIASFCFEAIQATSSRSVGIITSDELEKNVCLQTFPENLKFVKVDTVENFQGQEKDIIIIPCFSACPLFKNSFLSNSKKMSAALTRVKLCLIIIGHISSLMIQEDWKDLISYARKNNRITSIMFEDDVKSVFQKHVWK